MGRFVPTVVWSDPSNKSCPLCTSTMQQTHVISVIIILGFGRIVFFLVGSNLFWGSDPDSFKQRKKVSTILKSIQPLVYDHNVTNVKHCIWVNSLLYSGLYWAFWFYTPTINHITTCNQYYNLKNIISDLNTRIRIQIISKFYGQ